MPYHCITRKNLYAEEIAMAFWNPDKEMKKDWDPMIDTFEIKERLTSMAYVAHIVFKTMVRLLFCFFFVRLSYPFLVARSTEGLRLMQRDGATCERRLGSL